MQAHPDARRGGPGQETAPIASSINTETNSRIETATQGDAPRMRLISFKPIGKNGLAGFATVELAIGLRLFDLPVFSNGQTGPWVALPRKPQLNRDRHQRIGADGKLAFEPVAEWRDRETSDRFSAAVVELIRLVHPDAFDQVAA